MTKPTHELSAADIVLRAVKKWQQDNRQTFTEPHVQAAIAALLIAQKAQQDPAAVMEAHRAEDARKRAEDQWLDTYNAAIYETAEGDTEDAVVIGRAHRLADSTHGKRFVPAFLRGLPARQDALQWTRQPTVEGWYWMKQEADGDPHVAFLTDGYVTLHRDTGNLYAGPLIAPK